MDHEKAALADRLHELSKLTRAQNQVAPRNGQGFEIIARHSLNVPLPAHVRDDVKILTFLFCGNAPMVGYRNRRIVYILFMDRNFTAAPQLQGVRAWFALPRGTPQSVRFVPRACVVFC